MKYLFFLLLTFTFKTQAGTGSLSGVIVDKKNGDPIIGAMIKLSDGKSGATTDLNGTFTIKNIPEGEYEVVISSMSFTEFKERVNIISGVNKTINAALESATVKAKEVTISRKRKQESLTALTVIQKNSAVVADGISSDIIKKSPDRNTGDVIKRVSGASLQENKFAIVRGLADRYNNAMLGSTLLPSTEADRKSFSFDLIPASAIDNLMIFKTAAPDLSGDFAGGIIQITTKDIPDEKFHQFNMGTSFNAISTFKPFQQQQETNWDFLGLNIGSRSLPSEIPTDHTYNNLKNTEKYEVSKQFTNSFQPVNAIGNLGATFQYTNGWNMKKEKFEMGSIFSLNYNSNDRINTLDRSTFNADTTLEYQSTESQYRRLNTLGGLWNLGFKFNKNHKLSFMNLFNNNSESLVIDRSALDITTSDKIAQTIQQFTMNRLQSHQIIGEHCIGPKCMRLKYQVGVNLLNKELPDLRRTYYTRDFTNVDDTTMYAYASYSTDPRAGGRFYSSLYEKSFFAGIDFSIPFKIKDRNQTFKLGAYEQVKNRNFNTTVLGYVIANGSSFNENIKTLDKGILYDTNNIGRNGFVMRESYSPEDNYNALSNLTCGYVMMDNKITENLRAVWGLRMEYFGQELYTPIKGLDTLQTRHIYLDFLPSINLVYSMNEKSNLRFSVSKTLSRPEFRELSKFRFYDYSNNASIEGNPNLLRTNIYNVDLRYEIFQKFGQMFTISTFFKYFTNPIEQTVDFTGPETRVRSYVNAEKAINYGAEIETRLKLSSIFKSENFILSNTLFTINAAYIYSNVQFNDSIKVAKSRSLQGQSPYVINASLQYLHPESAIGVSLFYNVIGSRIFEVGNEALIKPNVVERYRHLLDFQVSKKVGKADLRLTISDILAMNSVFYVEFPNKDFARRTLIEQKNAPTISFSFSYKF